MAKHSPEKKQGQAKPRRASFIVRDTPAWLDQHQDWISDGGRQLYKAMRSLADAKTGELAIPGRGEEARWISPNTIDRKAGMCERTRQKYMRELIALGAVQHERKPVTRTIRGRLRKVRGVSRYTLLSLKRPIASNDAASTTRQTEENVKTEPQDSVSTTRQSTTRQAENGLLRGNSSTVQELPPQVLSETTTTVASGSVLGSEGKGTEPVYPSSSSKSTTEKSDDGGISKNGNASDKAKPGTIYVDPVTYFFSDKPLLYQWAKARILGRAFSTVSNPHGYVTNSLPEFCGNLQNEVFDYLQEKAIAALKRAELKRESTDTISEARYGKALDDYLLQLRDQNGFDALPFYNIWFVRRVSDYSWAHWRE